MKKVLLLTMLLPAAVTKQGRVSLSA